MLSTKAAVEEYVAHWTENADKQTRETKVEQRRSWYRHNGYMRPIIKALAFTCSGPYDEIFIKHKQLFYELYEANMDNYAIVDAILRLRDDYIAQGKSTESWQLLVRKNENGKYEEFHPLIAKYDDDYDDNLVKMIRQVVGLNSITELEVV